MPGQADVEHDRVERAAVGDLQALLGRGGDLDVVPLVGEGLAERPADARLVVDDQDAAHAAPFGVPVRSRQGEAEPRLAALAGSRRAARRARPRPAWASARPEPDALGLARDERLDRDSASSGGGPGPVSPTSMATSSPSADASSRTVPPGPAASMAFRVRFRTRGPEARLVGQDLERPVALDGAGASTLACWHDGSTSKATSARSRPRSHGAGGRRSTRPSERSPLTCSSVIASCRRATFRRLVAGRGRDAAWRGAGRSSGPRSASSGAGGPAPPRAGPGAGSAPICRMVCCISLQLDAHAVDRPGQVLRPRPLAGRGRARWKSPAAIRATCRCTRRIRPLIRWAIQLVTSDHQAERAGAEHQGRHRGLPPRLPPAVSG